MAAGLVERWVRARRALTEAEDSGDWDRAERDAAAARRELAALEARMTDEERREARRRFDAWFRGYLADDVAWPGLDLHSP
ncbi:MAG: hypothetical protein QJR14_09535 [Bacillota bacterium]|nr:hypothetical protein [Bacillota bacterium]